MTDPVDMRELAAMVRGRRQARSLTIRKAALDAGVSPATLWRVEKGDAPTDVRVISRLCDWLGVPVSRVMTAGEPIGSDTSDPIEHGRGESTAEMVEAHLRADRHLDAETAAALADAFKRMYEISLRAEREKERS